MVLCKFRKYEIQVMSAFIATLGMLCEGMQFSWVSPVVPKLLSNESHISITPKECEWIAQSYLIGCLVGAFFSFTIFQQISRKWSILLSSIPIGTAWLGNCFATTPMALYISRLIGGIGRNMIFVSVPMYLGEIASPEIRGVLGTFIYIMSNLGGLIAYTITPYTSYKTPAYVALSIGILQIILFKFLPESPYYSLQIGDVDRAKRSLGILRRKSDIQNEFEAIQEAVQKQLETHSLIRSKFTDLFTVKSNLKGLLILFFLRISQMMSGVSVMTMNIHTIFNGVDSHISTNISAIIYSFMMVSSAVCTIGTMDRFQRKPLMIFSSLFAGIALITQGTYFHFKDGGMNISNYFWVPLLSTFIFVYAYRAGLGTVPIVMIGELLNSNVKVPGIVISDIVYTIACFSSNEIFYVTRGKFGLQAPFWIFGSLCFLSAILSKIVIPETRGKTLDEIQGILKGNSIQETNV